MGRILRKKHETEPIVWDIKDNFGPFINQYKKRRAYYRKMKYSIKLYNIDDNSSTSIDSLSEQLNKQYSLDSSKRKKNIEFISD